jgi:hypothetical protein
MSELLEEVDDLPEEVPVLFSSSGTAFEIKSEDGHPMLKAIGIFILITCALGLANGMDYVSPESGVIRPDEWIYSMGESAPRGSGVLTGEIDSGEEDLQIHVSSRNAEGMWVENTTVTDANGNFKIEGVNPGLGFIKIQRVHNESETLDEVHHRIIISPPAFGEAVGYTNLKFDVPNEDHFNQLECEYNGSPCVRLIDHAPNEMEHPMMDPAAAGMYIMIGWGFIGLSIIAAGFALFGIKDSSRGLIRTGSVLVFFTVGHYWSACLFGLVAFALTFSVPRSSVILDS